MRTSICIIILVLFTSFRKTLLREPTLSELISYSNYILVGQIKELTDTTLTFQSIETLKGREIPLFKVYKRQRGEYSTRKINTNKPGQIELLFLTQDTETKAVSLSTNHGSAEYLVNDSVIYIYGRTWYLKKNNERYPKRFLSIDGNSIDASIYPKTDMCNAIKDYLRQAKSIQNKLYKEREVKYRFDREQPERDEVVLKNKDVLEFSSRSRSHRRIIDELIDDPANSLMLK